MDLSGQIEELDRVNTECRVYVMGGAYEEG